MSKYSIQQKLALTAHWLEPYSQTIWNLVAKCANLDMWQLQRFAPGDCRNLIPQMASM